MCIEDLGEKPKNIIAINSSSPPLKKQSALAKKKAFLTVKPSDLRSRMFWNKVDNIQVPTETKVNIAWKKPASCQGSLGNDFPI